MDSTPLRARSGSHSTLSLLLDSSSLLPSTRVLQTPRESPRIQQKQMANHRGQRRSSPPPLPSLSSSSRRSSPAPAWTPVRRRSEGWIGGYPQGVHRAALSDTSLAGHFRRMHPARPPGFTDCNDYTDLGADHPPEYASERGKDQHHHGVVHGARTGRDNSPSSPVIMPFSSGYNPQSGLVVPSDSDSEYQAAVRAASGDLGHEHGTLSDDGLPEYDHSHGGNPVPHPPPGDDSEDWGYIPSYLQPTRTPQINVDGSRRNSDAHEGGEDNNASSAPDYVQHAHLDQRSNRSSVHSNRALSEYAPSVGGTRSRAASLHSQLPPQDHHRSRASSFHSEHAAAAHQHEGPAGAGGGRHRGPSFALHPDDAASPSHQRHRRNSSASQDHNPGDAPHSLGRPYHVSYTSEPTKRSAQASDRRAFVPVARKSRLG